MEGWHYYESDELGFRMGVPGDWVVQNSEMVLANRARIDAGGPILQRRFQQATLPIFVATRFPDGYDDINPTVQVVYRPLPEPDAPVAQVLEKLLAGMGMILPEFRLVSRPEETAVSGLSAARARAAYALFGDEDRRFDIVGRMWIVPRDDMMFMISMSGPAHGENGSEEIFSGMVESIEIQRVAGPQAG